LANQSPFEGGTDFEQAPADEYLLYWLWQAAAASVVAATVEETESASGLNPVMTEKWPSMDTYLQLWV
jgi:hypothetical protein